MPDNNQRINTRKIAKEKELISGSSVNTPTPVPTTASNSQLSSPSAIDSLISKLEDTIIPKIESIFDKKLEELKLSFIDQLNEKYNTINNEIKCMQQKIHAIESQVTCVDDVQLELKRIQRSSDCIITGIPVTDKELPLNIYKCIANCINIAVSPYVTAFRVNKHSNDKFGDINDKGKSSSIIVKLSCPAERNLLFSTLRARKKPITLKDLNCGFVSDSNIGIFESLSSVDNIIKRRALDLKKNNLLHAVITYNGMVYVKIHKNSQSIRITSILHLNNLFPGKENNN